MPSCWWWYQAIPSLTCVLWPTSRTLPKLLLINHEFLTCSERSLYHMLSQQPMKLHLAILGLPMYLADPDFHGWLKKWWEVTK